ncbi:pyridoxal phosphate biosynthetic protein [Oceanicola granulosus HTCC2516]|uniref:Pyridoxal phosphate biosynthetic protein n=1 Tax=Oceanicola granulosus (strain ATCC BAA-861 / DSM 15982 / KCTC 12143 / HTCC2516) TaxID=314256 RepID=Q2CCP7_OCEGH|nr:hypothetical protein [Oceanicola granulosus]EAR50466.1 pyridoxal phosphate biosynthetic protein [Oceanicola granulosus HTCC2516]
MTPIQMLRPAALAACLALPLPLAAQSVGECDWRARADAIPEPWEAHTMTFANGEVRIALLDTIEPAMVPFHLLVLAPPYDLVGGRTCRVVSWEGTRGFYGLSLEGVTAEYDPAVGLRLQLPAAVPDADGRETPMWLSVTINQATGQVGAALTPDY